jgi:hypothetical protein
MLSLWRSFFRSNYPMKKKLETLQRLDQFRRWYSLNEKRYCIVCGKSSLGGKSRGSAAHVEMDRGASFVRRNVAMRPIDWVQPTDEGHRHLVY